MNVRQRNELYRALRNIASNTCTCGYPIVDSFNPDNHEADCKFRKLAEQEQARLVWESEGPGPDEIANGKRIYY